MSFLQGAGIVALLLCVVVCALIIYERVLESELERRAKVRSANPPETWEEAIEIFRTRRRRVPPSQS